MEPHEALDRFLTEVDHLDRILPEDERPPTVEETTLALSVAKRARGAVTLLIRTLAERRDTLQPERHKQ